MERLYKVFPMVNVKWLLNETTGNDLFMLSMCAGALVLYYFETTQRHAAILIKTNCFLYRRAKES